MENNKSEKKWIQGQVKKFKAVHGSYKQYAGVLEDVLKAVTKKFAPEAIVQVRAKAISSFAEKIQRKRSEYTDAVMDMTDLCGGRVITNTPSEVKAICEFIEEHFEIDWENSIDVSQRHKPAEFGYRSVHYIVSFRKGVFPTRDVNVSIPRAVFPDKNRPMKAEIQVRTLLEHAWAVFSHDRAYKGSFKVPRKLQRELASVAAILEDADAAFERIQAGLKTYESSYSAYMTEERIREEIEKLEFVLSIDANNKELAVKIGRLAVTIGDWSKAIRVLSGIVKSDYQPALKILGIALCKYNSKFPGGRNYKQGQKYLEKAIALDKKDADALASLAGTWKGIDDFKAGELYKRAFEIDPFDPYPLENYLTHEITKKKDVSIASMMASAMNASIIRCRDQADVGVNLPWAFFSMGKFYLLLKKPYEGLDAYMRAIQLSTSAFMIDTSLESLNKLSAVEEDLPGYEWIRRLLLIGRAAKFPTDSALKEVRQLATKGKGKIQGPVVIVAGGCDASVEEKILQYKKMLIEAFSSFKGAVVSGGTTQGICGLVGGIRQKYFDAVYTIGYIPKMVPADATVDKDPLRYKEIRYTDGNGFSPMEPIQNWIDLIDSGIEPAEVKVLGINGGTISSVEYRMALVMGARVAVIEESGREAARLLTDDFWNNSEFLLPMPADSKTVQAFIGSGVSGVPAEKREIMARAFHEHYRSIHKNEIICKDPSMSDWDKLAATLKQSNLQEADHIFEKLRRIGCVINEVRGRKVSIIKFSDREIEIMAEMEHGRWNAERLMDGWRLGEKKDVQRKISPYIVGWSELPENVREWDRSMVRQIPEILANVGLEIRRIKKKG